MYRLPDAALPPSEATQANVVKVLPTTDKAFLMKNKTICTVTAVTRYGYDDTVSFANQTGIVRLFTAAARLLCRKDTVVYIPSNDDPKLVDLVQVTEGDDWAVVTETDATKNIAFMDSERFGKLHVNLSDRALVDYDDDVLPRHGPLIGDRLYFRAKLVEPTPADGRTMPASDALGTDWNVCRVYGHVPKKATEISVNHATVAKVESQTSANRKLAHMIVNTRPEKLSPSPTGTATKDSVEVLPPKPKQAGEELCFGIVSTPRTLLNIGIIDIKVGRYAGQRAEFDKLNVEYKCFDLCIQKEINVLNGLRALRERPVGCYVTYEKLPKPYRHQRVRTRMNTDKLAATLIWSVPRHLAVADRNTTKVENRRGEQNGFMKRQQAIRRYSYVGYSYDVVTPGPKPMVPQNLTASAPVTVGSAFTNYENTDIGSSPPSPERNRPFTRPFNIAEQNNNKKSSCIPNVDGPVPALEGSPAALLMNHDTNNTKQTITKSSPTCVPMGKPYFPCPSGEDDPIDVSGITSDDGPARLLTDGHTDLASAKLGPARRAKSDSIGNSEANNTKLNNDGDDNLNTNSSISEADYYAYDEEKDKSKTGTQLKKKMNVRLPNQVLGCCSSADILADDTKPQQAAAIYDGHRVQPPGVQKQQPGRIMTIPRLTLGRGKTILARKKRQVFEKSGAGKIHSRHDSGKSTDSGTGTVSRSHSCSPNPEDFADGVEAQ